MKRVVIALGTSVFLVGCGLVGDIFGSAQVVVRAPELLEEVRYRATGADEALLAEGSVPVRNGQAAFRVPVPQGGTTLALEGRYGGFTYFKAERRASAPLDYPLFVELDASTRTAVSPTLTFANAPADTTGDEVVVCLQEPVFAADLGDPDCSPEFAAVAVVAGGGSVRLENLPAGPRYEVIYRTPTRVYRDFWGVPEAPTWRFDLNNMASSAR
jgi:hypothetical protein